MENPFELPNTSTITEEAPTMNNNPNPFSNNDSNPFLQQPETNSSFNNNNFQNNNNNFQNKNNFSQQQQKRKYKFVQLYMLINPKLFANQQLAQGEVPIMEISYNVDYGNLRLTFCNSRPDTFDRTSMKIQNMDRATTINIYPEVAEQILYNCEHWKSEQIHVFERMIQSTSSWSPNSSIFKMEAVNKTVTAFTQPSNSNNQFVYVFADWQLKALLNAMNFLINGSAWNLDLARFLSAE